MSTDYSITLTPSHECIPALLDFIIDHDDALSHPTRKELAGLLTTLDRARVRRLNMKFSCGIWHVEFVVNELVKLVGESIDFTLAVHHALNQVTTQLCVAVE